MFEFFKNVTIGSTLPVVDATSGRKKHFYVRTFFSPSFCSNATINDYEVPSANLIYQL